MIEARPDCKADSTGYGAATGAGRVLRRRTFMGTRPVTQVVEVFAGPLDAFNRVRERSLSVENSGQDRDDARKKRQQ